MAVFLVCGGVGVWGRLIALSPQPPPFCQDRVLALPLLREHHFWGVQWIPSMHATLARPRKLHSRRGEKQLFAQAMLKALAEVSGRKLPMIIDTPLARLDSIHRDRLVENFYPTASHQVIILSTDTEIDISYKEKLTPYLAQSYLLNFYN